MVAILFALISLLGLAGTWPILTQGVWLHLTGGLSGIQQVLETGLSARPGILFAGLGLDGIVLLVGVGILCVTLFLPTSNALVVLRRLILGSMLTFFLTECGVVIYAGGSIGEAAGLVFSTLMLLTAFAFAITNLGSKGALVSTMGGQRTSDSRLVTEKVTEFLREIAKQIVWTVRVLDGEVLGAKDGRLIIAGQNEVRIGRDPRWANVVVGSSHSHVSRRHMVVQYHPTGYVIKFIDAKYAIGVGDNLIRPHTVEATGMHVSMQPLSIEVVASWGPKLEVSATTSSQSLFSRKAIRAGTTILRNRYRVARTQTKLAVWAIFIGVLGGLISNTVAARNLFAALEARSYQLQQAHQTAQSLQRENARLVAQRERLQQREQELLAQMEREISEARRQALQEALEQIRQEMEETQNELLRKLDRVVGSLLAARCVFATLVEQGSESSYCTAWIGTDPENSSHTYLLTARHCLPDDKWKTYRYHLLLLEDCAIQELMRGKSTGEAFQACDAAIYSAIPLEIDQFVRWPDRDLAIVPLKSEGGVVGGILGRGRPGCFALASNPVSVAQRVDDERLPVVTIGFPALRHRNEYIPFPHAPEPTPGCEFSSRNQKLICNLPTHGGHSGGPVLTIIPGEGEEIDYQTIGILQGFRADLGGGSVIQLLPPASEIAETMRRYGIAPY